MQTPVNAILYFVIAAILSATGQHLYKLGADLAGGTVMSFFVNWHILSGLLCYIAVMVLFICAFQSGGEPKILYPIYASTFIWTAVIAYFAFGTPIQSLNIIGMLFLMTGICLMGQ